LASRFRDRRDRLEAELATSTAVLSRRFLTGVDRLRADREVRRLAREGRTSEILARYRLVAEDVANALQEEILRQATATYAEVVRQIGVPGSLDPSRGDVGVALRRQRDRLLLDLLSSQTRAIRAAGSDPELILASLGLGERQLAALVRYRELLKAGAAEALRRDLEDRTLEAELQGALDEGEPPTEEQRQSMFYAYGTALLSSGAGVLAGAEALVAVGAGVDAALGQAFDQGLLDPETLTGTWRTRGDERVRGSHRAMSGQVRPLGEPFQSGDGNLLRYPGDENAPPSDRVRCRCVVVSQAGVPARAGVA